MTEPVEFTMGSESDWFACGGCGWAAAGVWAASKADNHKRRGHLLVGDRDVWTVWSAEQLPRLRVLGCPACDLYGYLGSWIEWKARSIQMWDDHLDLVGPHDGSEPLGIDEQMALRPLAPETCAWLGDLDDRGIPLQAIAKMVPFVSCREHVD